MLWGKHKGFLKRELTGVEYGVENKGGWSEVYRRGSILGWSMVWQTKEVGVRCIEVEVWCIIMKCDMRVLNVTCTV